MNRPPRCVSAVGVTGVRDEVALRAQPFRERCAKHLAGVVLRTCDVIECSVLCRSVDVIHVRIEGGIDCLKLFPSDIVFSSGFEENPELFFNPT